jgi:hypothetical protein
MPKCAGHIVVYEDVKNLTVLFNLMMLCPNLFAANGAKDNQAGAQQ